MFPAATFFFIQIILFYSGIAVLSYYYCFMAPGDQIVLLITWSHGNTWHSHNYLNISFNGGVTKWDSVICWPSGRNMKGKPISGFVVVYLHICRFHWISYRRLHSEMVGDDGGTTNMTCYWLIRDPVLSGATNNEKTESNMGKNSHSYMYFLFHFISDNYLIIFI